MSYLYYNIEIYNDKTEPILAKFDETRVIPIIDNPSLYELSIVRFKVPAQNIPLLVWPGDNVYKISFTWRGQTVSSLLNFIPQGITIYGDSVYGYQELCDIINVAFLDCYTQMSILFPGPYPGIPDWNLYTQQDPIIIFNNATKFFDITVPWETAEYRNPPIGDPSTANWSNDPEDPTNIISVFFNESLGNLLTAFQYIVDPLSNDFRNNLLIKDNHNNIIQTDPNDSTSWYYFMKQSFTILNSINDLDDLLFRTSKIPVTSEYIGAQRNVTQQILTDFEVIESNYDTSDIQYFPSGPLRYYPLTTNYPLRDFDLQVFWKNRAGTEYPIYINPGSKLTIKIQFRKVPSVVLKDVLEDQQML